MGAKKKFYLVWVGHRPGVYDNWAECKQQIDGYKGARYKSFPAQAEAIAAYRNGPESVPPSPKQKAARKVHSQEGIIWESISVDAACSGNPGDLEYRGVDTTTGKELFRKGPFFNGTNNIGEFLAIVHALALLKGKKDNLPIYTDSGTAMAWIRKKKANSKLPKERKTATIWNLIERAEKWLKNNSYSNPILKWNTKEWGEIPADFGRK